MRPRRAAQTIYYTLARDDIRRLMEFLYASYRGDAAERCFRHRSALAQGRPRIRSRPRNHQKTTKEA